MHNISAKKYQNVFRYVNIVAKQWWNVFLTHSVNGYSLSLGWAYVDKKHEQTENFTAS